MRYFIRSSTYHILSHLQNADSENVFFFYPIALINTRPVHWRIQRLRSPQYRKSNKPDSQKNHQILTHSKSPSHLRSLLDIVAALLLPIAEHPRGAPLTLPVAHAAPLPTGLPRDVSGPGLRPPRVHAQEEGDEGVARALASLFIRGFFMVTRMFVRLRGRRAWLNKVIFRVEVQLLEEFRVEGMDVGVGEGLWVRWWRKGQARVVALVVVVLVSAEFYIRVDDGGLLFLRRLINREYIYLWSISGLEIPLS